ncbi:unnamed protein product [Paramecium primaurelia]|uniref:Spindle assembly abnormal protein 6 N-terminal domain-containing protein n=1 Tax=Paramecium primaurelia TaxID=5886 RepID=A0A8S1QDD3_PARPR|nr:unnamed protein product [Paramecium primaurelia]
MDIRSYMIAFQTQIFDSKIGSQKSRNQVNQNLYVQEFYNQGIDSNPQSIKIEISSEKDLFFLFHHEATINSFTQIKALQNLQMPFKDYAQITIATLNKVEQNFNGYGAIFQVMLDGSARLEINQTTEFRSVHMIHFDFHQVEESFLRQTIVFKYNQQRKEIKYLTQSLNECKMRATGTFK